MMTDEELQASTLARLRRKEDQAWDLAGCARRDNDKADEKRWTDEARRIAAAIGMRVRAGERQ